MSASDKSNGISNDGVDGRGMPPVSGATWVEDYERAGVHVSGYWRGPNGERLEPVKASGGHNRSGRLAPLDKKYDPDAARRAAVNALGEARMKRRMRTRPSPRRNGGGDNGNRALAVTPDGPGRITSISELSSTDHLDLDDGILESGSSPESYDRDLADVKHRLEDSSEDSVNRALEDRRRYLMQDNQKMGRIIDAAQAYTPDDIKNNQRMAKSLLMRSRAKLTALEKSSAIMDVAGNDEDGKILALNQARNIHPRNFIDPICINAIAKHDEAYAAALGSESFEVKSVEPIGGRIKFTFMGQKPGSYYPTKEWSQSVPKDQVNPDGISIEIHDARNTIKLLSSYASYDPSNDSRGFDGRMTDAVNLANASRSLGGSMTYEDVDPSIGKRSAAMRRARDHIKFNEINEDAYYEEVTDRILEDRSAAEHDAARLIGMNGMKRINVRDERMTSIERRLSSSGGRSRVVGVCDADHYLVEIESDPDHLQAEHMRGPGSARNGVTRSVVDRAGAVQTFRGSNEDILLEWSL